MTDESQDRPVLSAADQALLRSTVSPTDAQIDHTRKAIGARIAALAAGAAIAQATNSAQATGATAAGSTAATAATVTQSLLGASAAKWISAGVLVTAIAGSSVIATRRQSAKPESAPIGASSAPVDSARSKSVPAPKLAAAPLAPPRQPAAVAAEREEVRTAVAPLASVRAAAPRASAKRAQPAQPGPARALEGETLSNELSLLRSARQALERGDARAALRELDTHAALFREPVLRQEALAARALALCAAGRDADARRVALQLTRIAPRSPHLIRLSDSCARPDTAGSDE